MSMRYARKVLPAMGAKVLEGSQGLVEAYCSVFNNVDYAGEVIRPGFFTETITAHTVEGKSLPKVLWSHNMWELPLGITTDAEEVLPYDSRLPDKIKQLGGLRVVGQFNMDTQMGRDTFSNIKLGALDKYSIGYYVLIDQFDRETGVVELLKGDWLEWSPVNFAANDETLTVGAKNGGEVRRTEHLYIVRGPSEFVDGSFKRDIREHGNGSLKYTVVTGKLRSTGEHSEASIRFDADAWDASDAHDLCASMGRGTFEPATKGSGSGDSGTERLADNGARVAAQVSAYLERVEHIADLRMREGKAGRVLSEANRTILAGLLPDLKSVLDRVQKLLDDTAVASDSGNGKGEKPWDIVKRGDEYCVVNADTGRTAGCHATRAEALAQQRALYANEDSGKAAAAAASSNVDAANVRQMLGRLHVLSAELAATEV